MKAKRKIVRVSGRLREIVTIRDREGNILQKFMRPLMLEFYARDVIQVIIGAVLLTVPVAFTEEVWTLGQNLHISSIIVVMLLSLTFISIFIYYNYYKRKLKKYKHFFIRRVLATYLISLLVAGFFLSIIGKVPWTTDFLLAFKRTVLVAFPASMSAAVVDVIK